MSYYGYAPPRGVAAQTYLRSLGELRSQYLHTNQQLAELTNQNVQQVKELQQRTAAALVDLVAAILPTLDKPALDRAVELTGYIPLVQTDPLALMAKTHEQLARRVTEIEAERSYRDRMLLRAPRIGMLTREIAELEEFSAPLLELSRQCEHDRLEHLLEVGYGTAGYQVPFWRMSYYADWRAADRICSRFDGNKKFSEVRSELITARETLAVYDSKLAKLRAEVRAGELLESEHDNAQNRIANLSAEFLANLRGQLGSYLRDIDLVAIGDRLTLEPKIDVLAKRYFGLSKQTAYLRDSGQHLLVNTVAPVAATIKKLDWEIMKYQRPKLANSIVDASRMDKLRQMQQRNDKSRQQSERYQQTSTVVYSFNDYRYGRLDDDFLWWDLMAHSYSQRYESPTKIYGNFIPEVADFRASHPDYRYRSSTALDGRDDNESLAAAAAVHRDNSDDDQTRSSDIS